MIPMHLWLIISPQMDFFRLRASLHQGPWSRPMKDGLFPWSNFMIQLSWSDFLKKSIYIAFGAKCKPNELHFCNLNLTQGILHWSKKQWLRAPIKLLWRCLCLFDAIVDLHAMDEKMFNDFLIGKWKWISICNKVIIYMYGGIYHIELKSIIYMSPFSSMQLVCIYF